MPAESGAQADIPVIDINSSSPDVAQRLLDAASTYGFVFVANKHEPDIDHADVDRMFQHSREFFESPTEIKAECSIHSSKSGKNRGWLGMHVENLDPAAHKRGDFKEAFNFGEFINGKADQPLPEPLAKHEATIGQFADQCHNLCNKILRLFAKALEIPEAEGGETWFSARHDRSKGPSGSVLRLLYYPHIPPNSTYNPTTDIRAGAHSDYGSITLLFQQPSQPGLEILTPSGAWSSVPVNPTALPHPPVLVNIGDLLAYWTNGLLRSTVHRVIVPEGETADRYSIAYFCHPLDEARLVAVPSERVNGARGAAEVERRKVGYGGGAGEGGLAEGEVLTARDHLNRRLTATYGLKE